jgi:phosphoglycerate dehydrogenase-like enzyme
MVCIAPSSVFDDAALAEVLGTGRVAAVWFDSLEPGMLEPGRPLHDIDTLQITPRVASTTRESRVRSAWGVARRIDELLTLPAARPDLRGLDRTDDPLDLAAGAASA